MKFFLHNSYPYTIINLVASHYIYTDNCICAPIAQFTFYTPKNLILIHVCTVKFLLNLSIAFISYKKNITVFCKYVFVPFFILTVQLKKLFYKLSINQFRFAPTRPPTHWSGIFGAKSPGPACPQAAVAEAATAGVNLTREHAQLLNHQSEDCLTLNIYVPHQEEGEFFIFNWVFCAPFWGFFVGYFGIDVNVNCKLSFLNLFSIYCCTFMHCFKLRNQPGGGWVLHF